MRAIEETARRHYGRLLAWLAAGFRDLALAEDALQDALMAALKRWPEDGIPASPESWLLSVAKRRILDVMRRRKVSDAFAADIRHNLTEAEEAVMWQFPDNRLKLMFVCAHPQIDPALRAPLMLQTVLGLESARIAEAFVISNAAMSQRLVRVKARIAQAGLGFEIPDREDLPLRLGAVLDAIYAAYTSDWNRQASALSRGLTDEALYLVDLCAGLSDDEPEVLGLKALMLFCEARSAARYVGGHYMPLEQQATELWDHDKLAQAEQTLMQASRQGQLGRYQLEAAIQSAHVSVRLRGADPDIVLPLYRALVTLYPSLGAWVSYAAALVRRGDAEAAWQILDHLPDTQRRLYQPWWAVAAQVHVRLGDVEAAVKAFDVAHGLSDDLAVKAWLRQQRALVLN